MTATEIAYACGFSGSAAFSRAFRKYFSTTPTGWRKKYAGGPSSARSNTGKHEGNSRQSNGKRRKASAFLTEYPSDVRNQLHRRNTMTQGKVRIENFPEVTVAYVRHTGPYAGDVELFERLWGKLMAWAGPRKILDRPDAKGIIVYHDSPGITEEEKLRLSVCLTVPEDTVVDGEVGKMAVPGGEYAVSRFSVGPEEYGEAWQWVFGTWLPESGYQPDDRPCFEQYPEGDTPDENGKSAVEIVVPVKPL
jgi:AraC family transcriptional regulator